jgi:ubiquinone/menaquinone biosynthesis C-methylase UbiE
MSEEEIGRRMLEILKPIDNILDVGCGDGHLLNALASQSYKRLMGLDNSDHGFAKAKMKTNQTASHHLVECVECDGRWIAFKDDHFEAVMMKFSLHHIEETQLVLKEIHRILAPGGLALIHEWVVEDIGQPRDGCYRFTLEELEQMLRETGFLRVEVEQIEPSQVLVISQVI